MTQELVPLLRLQVEQREPWTVVHTSGELVWETRTILDRFLSRLVNQADRPCICIDLSDLEFFDSSGIGCVLRAWRATTRKGGALIVARPHGHLARKLRRLRLDSVLPIADVVPGQSRLS